MVVADYLPPADRMIIALKFGGRLPLAEAFGRPPTGAGRRVMQESDAIRPLPLAFERHAERGFNLAQEIARRVAAGGSRPLRDDIPLRTRRT